jgi:hypothetical protein
LESIAPFTDQPAHILQMRAKPGMGDRLFELATASLKRANVSDRFILFRADADPDVMWNIEVYRPVEAKDEYESSPLADEVRNDILDLLSDRPSSTSRDMFIRRSRWLPATVVSFNDSFTWHQSN